MNDEKSDEKKRNWENPNTNTNKMKVSSINCISIAHILAEYDSIRLNAFDGIYRAYYQLKLNSTKIGEAHFNSLSFLDFNWIRSIGIFGGKFAQINSCTRAVSSNILQLTFETE